MGKIYRQGDFAVERVDPRPRTDKRVEAPTATGMSRSGDRIILREGEATGHAHAIVDPEKKVKFVAERRFDRNSWRNIVNDFMVIAKAATIVHEEHAPVELPRGTYRILEQREYVPGRGMRAVRD